MQRTIERIRRALAAAGADLRLRPAVGEAALDAAAEQLGRELTPELRALLRVADGQDDPPLYARGAVHLFPAEMRLYSLEELLAEHASQAANSSDEGWDVLGAGDRVRLVSWHSGRVPFAGAEGTAWLWADDVPGPSGTKGQVLYNTTEVDIAVLGTSVLDFFERYADALERGDLVVSTDPGGAFVVHARDRDRDRDFYDVLCIAE